MRTLYLKAWRKRNRDKTRSNWSRWYYKIRKSALNIISNNQLFCIQCGDNDYASLEINHKYGGGKKEFASYKSPIYFYRDVVKGQRKTDDLEILCRKCNIKHAIEKGFITKIVP